jgi:IclR family acetate operon transcriptional repressor
LRKTFSILSCFRSKAEGLTLAEISKLTRINKSTAHRLLSHLQTEGFLQREDGRYRIGQALFQLGMLASQPLALLTAAYPIMAALAREIGETVNLAILDRTEILVLHAVESPHEFRMAAKVGGRRPFYVTSLGKASAAFLTKDDLETLLGSLTIPLEHSTPNSMQELARLRQELDAVRLRGYAIDNEEAVLGVRAVGAPVFKGSGELAAAISISGPTNRILSDRISAIASPLISAADSVTAALGGDADTSRAIIRQQHALPQNWPFHQTS